MNPNSVISTFWDERRGANYLVWEKFPYVKGKVLQIRHQQEADKHEEKVRDYIAAKVEGYNIFISAAGFTEEPGYEVPDYEIQSIINTMAIWYLKNIVPTLSKNRRDHLKSKHLKSTT